MDRTPTDFYLKFILHKSRKQKYCNVKHLVSWTIRNVPVVRENQIDVSGMRKFGADLGKAEFDGGRGVLEGSLLNSFGKDTRSTEVSLHTNKSILQTLKGEVKYAPRL